MRKGAGSVGLSVGLFASNRRTLNNEWGSPARRVAETKAVRNCEKGSTSRFETGREGGEWSLNGQKSTAVRILSGIKASTSAFGDVCVASQARFTTSIGPRLGLGGGTDTEWDSRALSRHVRLGLLDPTVWLQKRGRCISKVGSVPRQTTATLAAQLAIGGPSGAQRTESRYFTPYVAAR